MKKLVFVLFLFFLSISFANSNLTIYSNNFAVLSLEKKIDLKKGINFIPLDEVSGSIPVSSFYVLTQKGSVINEILYPNYALWIQAPMDMEEVLSIFYIIPNISWICEHLLLLDDNRIINFNSRFIVENNSSENFKNVNLLLLIGEPQILESIIPRTLLKAESKEAFSLEESIESKGEYKIFPYKEPITILSKQTKILPWLNSNNVSGEKIYFYEYQRDINSVFIEWNFINSKEKGLGIPLPAGKLRIFLKDGEKIIFLGESYIKNIAEGEKFSIIQGKAFDLKGERIVMESKDYIENKYIVREGKIQVIINNAKDEKVRVEIREYLEGDWQIISSSFPYVKVSKDRVKFILEVEPKKDAILNYYYKTKLLK